MQTLFHSDETEQNGGRNGQKEAGNGQQMCFTILMEIAGVLNEEYSTHFGSVCRVVDSTQVRM